MALIVIEGLDGAGKSTQIDMLQEYLRACGHRCHSLHFPRSGDGVYGDLIARFLRGELGDIRQVNPYLTALIYAGDRLEFKPVLEKWLDNGDTVLLDRYVYSNIAYQCAKIRNEKERDALRQWIIYLEFGYNGLPRPDLNIFLNVPFCFTQQKLTEERNGDERNYLQGKRDIHEADLDFQKRVRETYLSLKNEPGFTMVDCSGRGGMLPAEQIFDAIHGILKNKTFMV